MSAEFGKSFMGDHTGRVQSTGLVTIEDSGHVHKQD